MQEIHNAKISVLLISNETQTLTKTRVKLVEGKRTLSIKRMFRIEDNRTLRVYSSILTQTQTCLLNKSHTVLLKALQPVVVSNAFLFIKRFKSTCVQINYIVSF